MAHLRKQAKSLLIFDLNGVLGHYSTDYQKFRSTGIYHTAGQPGDDLTSVDQLLWSDRDHAIFGRPSLRKVTFDMLVREKKKYDIGIWSSNDQKTTELLVKHLFGRQFTQ